MPPRPRARSRALLALLRPTAGRWLALGLMVASASGLALAGPLVVRRVVDEATAGTTSGTIVRLAVAFLAIAAARQVALVVVAWFATASAWRTTNALRLRMTDHVLRLDHGFHRRHTPGELVQRVDGDITSVSEFLGTVVPKAVGALLTVGGMVIVVGSLDWRLGIGMVAYVVFAVAVVVRGRHLAVAESSDEMNAMARLYGGIEERLTAAEDLRAAGAASHAAWRFVEDSAVALRSAVRRERAFLVMWWRVHMSMVAGWVIVLVAGALLVSREVITVGTAFLMYQYVLLIAQPLEEVVHQLETVQKANGAMVRVTDLLGVEPAIIDSGTISPPPGSLSVECRGVDFDYGDDQPVLRGVDLALGAGRSLGIVGRTGSGKTTFSRLVLRLVEPTAGSLLLGDVPVQEIPLAEMRRRVSLVPQEVELFSGTVRDNVTLFDDGPPDRAVEDALCRVGLDALVAGGIHRELGAAGAGLSAGEAQLLALARVWLRDPDLLVLDEATARVDPETEHRLEEAVAALVASRTTLIIAHRLSTLRSVDDIAVFDHGRIVEFGERTRLAGDDESRYATLLAMSLEREDSGRAEGAEPDAAPAASAIDLTRGGAR